MPLFVNETFAINAVVRFRVLKSWQSSADHCKSLPYTYILAQYSRCSPFNCVKDEKWSLISWYMFERRDGCTPPCYVVLVLSCHNSKPIYVHVQNNPASAVQYWVFLPWNCMAFLQVICWQRGGGGIHQPTAPWSDQWLAMPAHFQSVSQGVAMSGSMLRHKMLLDFQY